MSAATDSVTVHRAAPSWVRRGQYDAAHRWVRPAWPVLVRDDGDLTPPQGALVADLHCADCQGGCAVEMFEEQAVLAVYHHRDCAWFAGRLASFLGWRELCGGQ
jgi:hypothetical protein